MNKQELGKFYTINNPFLLKPFIDWFNNIPNILNLTLLEPFAGSNNIVNMVKADNNWVCFDILPTENNAPKFPIIQQDTILNFPGGYEVAITNPPYLAKNMATKCKLNYQGDIYDDLYKKCLEVMLANCKYVAAIIPESFITANIFQDRLTCIISLTCKMFDDTKCPVCLALFSELKTDDFEIYRMNEFLGTYNELLKFIPKNNNIYKFKMNDPNGYIGIICIDDNNTDNIKFIDGNLINSNRIKISSRQITRVSANIDINDLNIFFVECNNILSEYRKNTEDVFLTSFRNMRKDGKYRRRLDFDTAKAIMNTALIKIMKNS